MAIFVDVALGPFCRATCKTRRLPRRNRSTGIAKPGAGADLRAGPFLLTGSAGMAPFRWVPGRVAGVFHERSIRTLQPDQKYFGIDDGSFKHRTCAGAGWLPSGV